MSDPSTAGTAEARCRPPVRERSPLVKLVQRLGVAVGLLLFVAIVVYAGRAGYVDDAGGEVGFLDAVYYASVTVTTTGYGDITPVTPGTRLATALLVTPARILFLLLLVGTTVELLTSQWREALRRERWRRRVDDHYIICGYGVKGRSAARALLDDGVDPDDIVVVEPGQWAAEEARTDGFTSIAGDASRVAVLEEARVRDARAIIVAPHRDDSAVLITLTARELNPDATIVSAVREEQNAHLLRQSGADAAITSSEASGRLLGVTTRNPRLGEVVDDLLHTAQGLALAEREVEEDEIGKLVDSSEDQITLAVVRDGRLLRYDDPSLGPLRRGDRIVGLPILEGDDQRSLY